MDQALQDLRITSSILQRKYNDLESEKKQLEKDMEEERRALTHHIDELVAEMSTLRKERNELKEQLKEAMVFKVSFNEVQSLKAEIKRLKESHKQEFKMRVLKTRELINKLWVKKIFYIFYILWLV